MSSSIAYPETPSAYVPLSIRQNKFHAHTKQWQYYLLTYLFTYLLTYLLSYLFTYSMEQSPS